MQEVISTNPHFGAFTKRGFAESVHKEIDESFLPVIALLTGMGFVVGAAVVGLTIYTATIERIRDFAVMKAVGASGGFLYRIVLSQSTLLTAFGFLVGLAAAYLVSKFAREAVPEFATDFILTDTVGILAASIIMAVLASVVPVRRINRIDPAEVFRA